MSFKQIRGHDRGIQLLKSVWMQNKLPSAYLFVGPEGIGKSFVARTFAKFINCLNKKIDDSCDSCISCIKIDKGIHPDVHLISADMGGVSLEVLGDSIKIDQIRQLQKDISLKPYEAKIKIFIINDAEKLTLEASNAFLKILEEPPADSLIILITSKPQLLLPTILSRCQRLKFSPLEKNLLKELLNKEYKLNNILSHYLAYFCEGRLGKALNLKDKDTLINKNRIIDYFTSLTNYYENIEFNKNKIKESLDILSSWFRDMYFIKIGMPYMQLINIDRKNDLMDLMNRYSLIELDSIFDFISCAALYLEQNVNPKLLLSNLKNTVASPRK